MKKILLFVSFLGAFIFTLYTVEASNFPYTNILNLQQRTSVHTIFITYTQAPPLNKKDYLLSSTNTVISQLSEDEITQLTQDPTIVRQELDTPITATANSLPTIKGNRIAYLGFQVRNIPTVKKISFLDNVDTTYTATTNGIYDVQILDGEGKGNLSNLLKAMDWSIRNKMNVIVIEATSIFPSRTLQELCQKAMENNIKIISPAIKDNKIPHYPQTYLN